MVVGSVGQCQSGVGRRFGPRAGNFDMVEGVKDRGVRTDGQQMQNNKNKAVTSENINIYFKAYLTTKRGLSCRAFNCDSFAIILLLPVDLIQEGFSVS